MSGGHFGYVQCEMSETQGILEKLIREAETQAPGENGEPMWPFQPETIEKFRTCLKTLRLATQMLQRVDWLICGDDGEDTFHARWKEDGCE